MEIFLSRIFSNKIINENIFYEIYLYNICLKIKKNIEIKKLVIPYEENGWQRAIIVAFQDKKILKYGYTCLTFSGT